MTWNVGLAFPTGRFKPAPIITTFTIDTATSRANPAPAPMKRLTVASSPRARKKDGVTADPIVMLTAYTARTAQLLDAHCDDAAGGRFAGTGRLACPPPCPSAWT